MAIGHLWQIVGLLRGCTRQRNGPAAQALHGKGKISQWGVKGQCFAQHYQRPGVQPGECAAQGAVNACRHAITQPAPFAQQLYPLPAGQAVIALIDLLARRPFGQLLTQITVHVLKKRQAQMCACLVHGLSPP